jgi:hypothetical protein
MAQLAATGTTVQLRLFDFDPPGLSKLLDLGVRWFVTDAPERFSAALTAAWRIA